MRHTCSNAKNKNANLHWIILNLTKLIILNCEDVSNNSVYKRTIAGYLLKRDKGRETQRKRIYVYMYIHL